MGWTASKSDFFINGFSSPRDFLTLRLRGFAVSGVLRFPVAARQMHCMDELVRNMDMIRYEYSVCYND
jgi:hypothetical protein